MKRVAWIAAGIALLALIGMPRGKRSDVAELVPVQALIIDAEQGKITITTDTGDTGSGASLDAAFSDLRAGCAGQLFTQTAEHVLLTARAWYLMPQVSVSQQLRPAAKLYRVVGQAPQAQPALEFLQAHPGSLTLSHTRAALLENRQVQAPQMVQTEGGLRLGR